MRPAGILAVVGCVIVMSLMVHADEKKKGMITGTIVFKEKPTFPRGTEVQIQVQDTSRADARAIVVGTKTIKDPKEEKEIAFTVEYDPEKIQMRGQYSLSVRITHAKKLLYINDTRIAVINPPGGVKDVKAPVIAIRR